MQKPKVKLMLDSGAYGAWSRGTSIDLEQYIEFIHRNKHLFDTYVALDVIPGSYGQKRTRDQVEQSAKKSHQNLRVMKDAGLEPIPVFHQGERFYWLEKMLNEGETYIGISPSSDAQINRIRDWMDEVFTLITDDQGKPLIKTHGFGVTSPSLLMRYPWSSGDSASWTIGAAYGMITVPRYKDGKPDYKSLPHRVKISDVSSASATGGQLQYDTCGPLIREHIRKFLEEEVGVTITQVRTTHNYRRDVELVYYLNLAKTIKVPYFKHKRSGFCSFEFNTNREAIPSPQDLRILFATFIDNKQQSANLNKANAEHRLLSYYPLIGKDEAMLEEYVMTGKVGEATQTKPPQNWNNQAYLISRKLAIYDRMENSDDTQS